MLCHTGWCDLPENKIRIKVYRPRLRLVPAMMKLMMRGTWLHAYSVCRTLDAGRQVQQAQAQAQTRARGTRGCLTLGSHQWRHNKRLCEHTTKQFSQASERISQRQVHSKMTYQGRSRVVVCLPVASIEITPLSWMAMASMVVYLGLMVAAAPPHHRK